MQTAGDFITAAAKLTAGVQHGHDHFKGRFLFLGMDIHRNTAPIIRHGDTAVGVNGDDDPVAGSSQGFVDRVIDYFVNQVVKGFEIGSANIHTRAAANSLEPFQNLDIFCSIRSGRLIHTILR